MKLDIAGKNIWQVGSGDDTRPYDDLCLKFGIAMVGPGYCGDVRLPENVKAYKDEGETDWGSYLRQVKKGHFIILRKGRKKIVAVGKVLKEYEYSNLLSDIHGWDLQHYIGVEWYVPVKQIEFSGTPLAMSTLAGVNSVDVIDRISDEEFKAYQGENIDLSKLAIPKKIGTSDVSHSLVDYGIRIQDAENISNTIERIIKLAHWYNQNDCEVLEHEIRTFLVIPLLISLGWSEQKIKIEYNKIDVAIFSKPFKGNYKESPKIIIETKRFHDGLHYATEAAKYYAKEYQDCTLLIATNGCRYKLYEKNGDTFIESGYLNFFDMREHHYLDDNIYGAIQCLIQMSSF